MNKPTFFGALFILSVLIFFTLGSCHEPNHNKPESSSSIVVFAASSLNDVLSELTIIYEKKTGIKIKSNSASSGTLARQIEQGANPDIYISANERWVNYVDQLGLIKDNYHRAIVTNSLVLIAPKSSKLEQLNIDSSTDLLKLLGNERLSIGDPTHVPSGIYTKQALEYYQLYSNLIPRILPAKDVRSALMIVELKEAPLGIVYSTDAKKSNDVKILATFNEESHEPIVYYQALCTNNLDALEFYKWLNSEEAQSIWTKYGFKPKIEIE